MTAISEDQAGRDTYTVPEVASIVGLGLNQTYEAIGRGEIPSLRFRGRLVVPKALLHRMLGRPDDWTPPSLPARRSRPKRLKAPVEHVAA